MRRSIFLLSCSVPSILAACASPEPRPWSSDQFREQGRLDLIEHPASVVPGPDQGLYVLGTTAEDGLPTTAVMALTKTGELRWDYDLGSAAPSGTLIATPGGLFAAGYEPSPPEYSAHMLVFDDLGHPHHEFTHFAGLPDTNIALDPTGSIVVVVQNAAMDHGQPRIETYSPTLELQSSIPTDTGPTPFAPLLAVSDDGTRILAWTDGAGIVHTSGYDREGQRRWSAPVVDGPEFATGLVGLAGSSSALIGQRGERAVVLAHDQGQLRWRHDDPSELSGYTQVCRGPDDRLAIVGYRIDREAGALDCQFDGCDNIDYNFALIDVFAADGQIAWRDRMGRSAMANAVACDVTGPIAVGEQIDEDRFIWWARWDW